VKTQRSASLSCRNIGGKPKRTKRTGIISNRPAAVYLTKERMDMMVKSMVVSDFELARILAEAVGNEKNFQATNRIQWTRSWAQVWNNETSSA
jgi:hypothetical protein